MMRQTPLGHDGTTTRNDTCYAVSRQRNITQQHTGMDGEVIHALLCLFNQGVAEQLPGQVFGLAVNLLQGLVDGHGTNRHRRITQNPFTGFMNIFAGRKVHQGIATPASRPGHLLDFFFDRGSHCRVTDISIDLDQEITANNHWLEFRVIDITGNNGATTRDLITHKLRRDLFRQIGSKGLALMLDQELLIGRVLAQFIETHGLADRDVFHLGRNNALARIVHLGHVGAVFCLSRFANVLKAQFCQLGIVHALLAIVRCRAIQQLGITTLLDPCRTQVRHPLHQVDLDIRIGKRARRVIYRNRWINLSTKTGRGIVLVDLAHTDANVRARPLDIDLAGIGKWTGNFFGKFCRLLYKLVWDGAHDIYLDMAKTGTRAASLPSPA